MNMRLAQPNKSMQASASRELPPSAVEASIVVAAPVAQVYKQWLQVEDYPKFMHAIKTVRKLDGNHFAVHGGVVGQPFDAVLEIMLRVPERRVAWRLLQDHLTAGVVRFVSLSNGRTHVTLKMMSSFGGALAERVETYLRAFKSLVETKERAAEPA